MITADICTVADHFRVVDIGLVLIAMMKCGVNHSTGHAAGAIFAEWRTEVKLHTWHINS
jgi:hypothetical protein